MMNWEFYGDHYCITSDKNGDVILDEIIKHFDENNSDPTNKTLVINQEELEHNFEELRKYQIRLNHYYDLGYEILVTD